MLLLIVYIILFSIGILIFLSYKGVIPKDILIRQPSEKEDIKKSTNKKNIVLIFLFSLILLILFFDTFSKDYSLIIVLTLFLLMIFIVADIINNFIKLNSRLSIFVDSKGFKIALIFLLFLSFVVSSMITLPI